MNPEKLSILAFACEKGGTGKSTAAVCTASALSRRGKTVLLVDLDATVHTSDLLFGAEDRALFGLSDLVAGRNGVPIKIGERLFICPPPDEYSLLCRSDTADKTLEAAENCGADYLIFDLPSKVPEAFSFVSDLAKRFIIVTTQDKASVLGAEITAKRVSDIQKECLLLINRFDLSDLSSYHNGRESVCEIIDRTHIPLLGVIPECRELLLRGETGESKEGSFDVFFDNVAARLENESVPLFEGAENAKKLRKSV